MSIKRLIAAAALAGAAIGVAPAEPAAAGGPNVCTFAGNLRTDGIGYIPPHASGGYQVWETALVCVGAGGVQLGKVTSNGTYAGNGSFGGTLNTTFGCNGSISGTRVGAVLAVANANAGPCGSGPLVALVVPTSVCVCTTFWTAAVVGTAVLL